MPPKDDDRFEVAASRHLVDAHTLLVAGRFDGAVYLAGYVAECSLKFELVTGLGDARVARKFSHNLAALETSGLDLLLALSSSPRPYVFSRRLAGTSLDFGHPMRRYWADGWTQQEATDCVQFAAELYAETVGSAIVDGVIEPYA